MSDIADFLRARLKEQREAVIRYRDGHDGPCVNYAEQDPKHYDEHDPCSRHLEAAEASAYRDTTFGLADLDAKLAIVEEHHSVELPDEMLDACNTCELTGRYPEYPCRTLRLLAQPFAGHPDHKGEEWAP
ncbi:DUF6221 family protein [Streptomyces sp. NPDC007875]|uniref:DUF6221 family protein n=1 Tax=Streptomyces sp. NPDC007875 TaxID=3364783 RepID=UPI003691D216